jgi:hypothetical protein
MTITLPDGCRPGGAPRYSGRAKVFVKPHIARFHSGTENNPRPSTARGRRRHKGRTEKQRAHAEKCWGMA